MPRLILLGNQQELDKKGVLYNYKGIKPGDIFYSNSTTMQSESCYLQMAPGLYFIECWGAQGGSGASNTSYVSEGGYGAYASAVFQFVEPTEIWVAVGGGGYHKVDAKGGINGGGNAYSKNGRAMNSGGGATDVRFHANSLYNRAIVAGGGGGAHETTGSNLYGYQYGYGGGWTGGAGGGGDTRRGFGGELAKGGTSKSEKGWDSHSGLDGSFGQGGGAGNYNSQYINGAGGGWYGGGAGGPDGGAGGGSSFIWCPLLYTKVPTGYNLTTKDMSLGYTKCLGGNVLQPVKSYADVSTNSDGSKRYAYNTGSGYVCIHTLEVYNTNKFFFKDNGIWKFTK